MIKLVPDVQSLTTKGKRERFNEFVREYISRDFTDWLDEKGFFTAPASTKYHGNYAGGLLEHSLYVTETLSDLTQDNLLEWGNSRSPYIIGMFHDLCKIDQYCRPVSGVNINGKLIYDTDVWEHNSDCLLKGHGEKSVMLLSQFMLLTEEEILCIRYHMGAFTEQAGWNDYTRAISRYPNVLWTHHADMIAAHVRGL